MAKRVRIISVGKTHDQSIVAAITLYSKRLLPFIDVTWCFLPPKNEPSQTQTITSESERILKTLEDAEYVIVLDERGKQMDSPTFSITLYNAFVSHKSVAIIIGGAYGVDEHVRSRADLVLSFGPMVFPHQLVRVMLLEQIYRATTIHVGSGYHHS